MVIVFENLNNPEETKQCDVCGTYFVNSKLGPDQCGADCFEVAERTKVMELHIRNINDDET